MFRCVLLVSFFTSLLLMSCAMAAPPGTLKVDKLRCEYLDNPVGLDMPAPRLGWILKASGFGAAQTAYRIQMAASPEALDRGDAIWDTAKVVSDRSIQVPYGGRPLVSRERVYWRVRVWDQDDAPSPWSAPAFFEMGLLSPADWEAEWITEPPAPAPAPLPNLARAAWIWHPDGARDDQTVYFRASFRLPEDAAIARAVAQFTADNRADLYINGKEAGRAGTWQQLSQFTVTDLVHAGQNTVAIRAHNQGAAAGLLAAFKVELEGGDSVYLGTGPGWRVTTQAAEGWETRADIAAWRGALKIAAYGAAPWGAVPVRNADPQPAPLFRRDFRVEGKVVRARAYVCGLGYNEFYLNGKKIGDHVLDPAQTDYQKRAFYVVHDVTDALKQGDNTAGIWLGDGWFDQSVVWGGFSYGQPCTIAQIEITYEDGVTQRVVTDGRWRVGQGPVRGNNIYAGETYNARLVTPGWASPGFEAEGWRVAAVRPSPTETLQAQLLPPIKRIKEIRPVAITNPASGVYIVDMGQNFAGWAKLRIRGERGERIRMRFAEALTPDGLLDPRSTGIYATKVVQTDTYYCKGGGMETWEPRFTYHGFRYVELTGCSRTPDLRTLTGVVVHTAVTPVGRFTCSDPLLNRIHETALWTECSNLHGIPTDCPHRERCGWLGDAHVSAEMTIFNFAMARFWTKYMRDVETSLIDGVTPTYVAPGKRTCGAASHDWATALYQVPWYLYVYYGDRAALEEHYASGARWLEEIRTKQLDDHLILQGRDWHVGLGDWCPPGGNRNMQAPVPLTSTVYVYYDHMLMAQMARILGKPDDARFYEDFAARQREQFNAAFYDAANHTYGSQTANALALYVGLVPDGDAAKVAESLAYDVRVTAQGHHTTGIMGSRYLFGELSRYGHGDEALGILQQRDYPSIGWLFELGATTLWESWGRGVEPGGEMPRYSLNHPMQGGFDAWFYDGICGIRPDPEQPGFKHFFVEPRLVGDLQSAKAEFDSSHGLIRSSWKRSTDKGYCDITVPANTTATLLLPCRDLEKVRVNGQAPARARGVKEVTAEGGLLVGAGRYRVQFPLE